MKTLLVAVLLMGLQSYAQAQSAYDTLRNAFNNASMPATTEDFDSQNWQGCAYADISNPGYTRETMVRLLEYTQGPGHGPLFPGDTGYRVDVFQDYSLDQNLVSFFQSSRIQENENYFVQSLDGPPWRHLNIYGRVDVNMLFFHVELSDYYGPQAPMYPRVYGYCWTEQAGQGDEGDGQQPPPIPLPN